jgi:hypothetical protein
MTIQIMPNGRAYNLLTSVREVPNLLTAAGFDPAHIAVCTATVAVQVAKSNSQPNRPPQWQAFEFAHEDSNGSAVVRLCVPVRSSPDYLTNGR